MRKHISKYIKELSKEIANSTNILLVCHTNPDGDAIGSMLGFYHYLKSNNKQVSMISPNSLQKFLKWMDGAGEIIIFEDQPGTAIKNIKEADLAIYLDFSDDSRIGRISDLVAEEGIKRILIDHHPKPTVNCEILISEPGMSSTAELVFELISQMEATDIVNPIILESLYVGMMTDTGNFNFGTFDGETLRNVSRMLDTGLRKDFITDRVYNNFSANRMRLLGYSLAERMVVLPQYMTAYIYLSLKDLDRFNFVTGDTEGFVNYPLSIDGILFSVLFIEHEDHIRLSLRSKGSFPVNEFSEEYFNGGGHKNAAGGRSTLSLNDCLARFESLLPLHKEKIITSFLR